jgi:hypothetical protein
VGTPEIERATDWIRARFDSLGLEPAGDAGMFDQRFDLAWTSLGDGSALTVSGSDDVLEPGEGWFPLSFSATTAAAGDVVFAGFGIVEPQLGYDDYQGTDVTGKIVLVLEARSTASSRRRPRATTARRSRRRSAGPPASCSCATCTIAPTSTTGLLPP